MRKDQNTRNYHTHIRTIAHTDSILAIEIRSILYNNTFSKNIGTEYEISYFSMPISYENPKKKKK